MIGADKTSTPDPTLACAQRTGNATEWEAIAARPPVLGWDAVQVDPFNCAHPVTDFRRVQHQVLLKLRKKQRKERKSQPKKSVTVNYEKLPEL